MPAIANTNTGSVDQFDPITMQLEKSLPAACSPAGLVVTSSQHLMTSCGEAFDVAAATSLGRTLGASADQLWYNPGDNFSYFGGAFSATSATAKGSAVLDGNTNQLVTYIQANTHTLAVNPNNNRVFIPVTGSGIQVWAAK